MDHYLVLGRLCGSTPAAQSRCLGNCTHFTIRPLATPDRVDHIFAEIRRAITRPPYQENHFQTWILPDTWSLIETRIAELQQKYQRSSWALSHTIKAGIQEDRCRRAAEEGSTVDSLLAYDPPLIQEARIRMRIWYKAAVDRPPTPDRLFLVKMTAERVEIYRYT